MRLIDADALDYESIDSCDTLRHESYYGTGITAIRKEDVDAAPTVEPEVMACGSGELMVQKGTWLGNYTPFKCDKCGKTSDSRTPFCRYCGADMRE